jgi:hypothetical protein
MLGLAGAVLAGGAVFRAVQIKQSREKARAAVVRSLEEHKPRWAAHRFVAIVDNPDFDRIVDTLPLAAPATVDEACRAAARESVRAFFKGYATGSYDDYRKFRTPAGSYAISPSVEQWLRMNLVRYAGVKAEDLPADPEQLFRYCWDKDIWSGKAYFESVAPESIRAEIAFAGNRPARLNFAETMPDVSTVGHINYKPFFVFPDQPRYEDLAASKPLLLLTIASIVDVRDPDFPMPVLFRYYWSDAESKWLPLSVAIGCAFGINRAPSF